MTKAKIGFIGLIKEEMNSDFWGAMQK
ncbi:MAG: hypothetical protein K0R75_1233, partial [Paenibacillaceae bacterium]|nr:hypothetical protein [Paenibacillaceae bacterium]